MKKILKIILVIVLIAIPHAAFAVGGGGSDGGHGAHDPSCSAGEGLNWCYSDIGLRLSLYKYKDGVLTTYGSVDYEANSSLNGREAYTTSGMKGKVYYTATKTSPTWSSSPSTILLKDKSFVDFYSETGGFIGWLAGLAGHEALKLQIKNLFKLNTGTTATKVLNAIKAEFGSSVPLTASDLKYVYISAEPTIYAYDNVNSKNYYGSAYEFLRTPAGSGDKAQYGYHGINGVLYYKLPRSLYTQTLWGVADTNGFITQDDNGLVRKLVAAALPKGEGVVKYTNVDGDKYRAENREKVTGCSATTGTCKTKGIYGFGLQLYWVGENVKASCKDTCNSYSGDEYWKCAENYCEGEASGAANAAEAKETCMTGGYNNSSSDDCAIQKPSSSCPTSVCHTVAGTTACDSEAASAAGLPPSSITTEGEVDNKNCKEISDNNDYTKYIKISCTNNLNKTKYVFSNDLPTVLLSRLGGFNYSVMLNTVKDCVATFNTYLARYNYAVALHDNKASVASTISTYYSYYNLIKTNARYSDYWRAAKLVSNNTTFRFRVENDSLLYDQMKKTSTIPTPEKREYSTTDSAKSIKFFDSKNSNASLRETTAYSGIHDIELHSESNDYYELQPRCYTLKTGRVNRLESDSLCRDVKKYAFHYGYYSNQTAEKVKTTAHIVNNDLCIDQINRCQYYNDPKNISCYTKFQATGGSYKVEMYLNGKKQTASDEVKYSFDGGPEQLLVGNINSSPIASGTYTSTNKGPHTAYIKYKLSATGREVKKSCDFYIPENLTNTCKATFKTTGATTCYQANKVEEYCKEHWTTDTAGYKSAGDCVNDCVCTTIINRSKEYVYRPISIGNPFPNSREPGDNWNSTEAIAKAKEDHFGDEPLYVIKLDKDAIRTIKQDTAESKSKYIDFKDTGGDINSDCYESDLIRGHSEIFTVTEGVCD